MMFDRQGDPICIACFSRLRETLNYCRLGWTVLDEGQSTQVIVSTVWMGLDMGMAGDIPLIFETMVFLPPDEEQKAKGYSFGSDVYCDRYATEVEALIGHDRAVGWAKDTLFLTDQEIPGQK